MANINLLSPAFNLTSSTFQPLYDSMVANIDLDEYYGNALYGMAGNVYNDGGVSMSDHYVDNGAQERFANKRVIITETGNNGGTQMDLGDTLSDFFANNSDVQGSLLFNALGTHTGFPQHVLSDAEITSICSKVNCSKLGINFANGFGEGLDKFSKLNDYNMNYALQIAFNQDIQKVLDSIASLPAGGSIIIRVGTAGDTTGWYSEPIAYIAFLNEISRMADLSGGKKIYAIAGPNEPDAESWVNPGCYIACGDGTMRVVAEACSAGGVCESNLAKEQMVYLNTDIDPPFKMDIALQSYGSAADDIGDLQIPDGLSGIMFAVSANGFDHTDRTPFIEKLAGSLNPASDQYINKRANPFECIGKEDQVCGSVIPHVVLSTPGNILPGVFNVGNQPPMGFYNKDETYEDYSRRLLSASTVNASPTNDKFGTRSFFKSPVFVACIQKDTCDPKVTGFNSKYPQYRNCLNANNTETNVPPSVYFCDKEANPNECIGAGKIVFLTEGDNLSYIENPTVNAQKLALWRASSYMTLPPGFVKDPVAKQDRGITTANLTYNTPASTKNIQTKQTDNSKDIATTDEITDTISRSIKTKAIKQAYAEVAPPWGSTQSCQGLGVLVEDKGNSFSVKLWNTNEVMCGDLSDAVYNIAYTLVTPEGERISAGGCNQAYIIGGDYPHHWDPSITDEAAQADPQLAKQKWGVPIESWPGCGITVSPQMGTLEVSVQITSSRMTLGPDDGCFNQPSCMCNDDSCRNRTVEQDPMPINCSICNSWAPPTYCQTFNDVELKEEMNCAEGNCTKSTDIKFLSSGNIKDTLEQEGDHNVIQQAQQLINLIQQAFSWFGAGAVNAVVSDFGCSYSTYEYTVGCTDSDGECTGYSWSCGQQKGIFSMFGYVPKVDGNMELYTTAIDMKAYDAIGLIPGVTNEYFEVAHTTHKAYLSLGLNNANMSPVGIDSTTAICPANVNSSDDLPPGLDMCVKYDIKILDEFRTTSFDIQYFTHYQQMAQHCATQAMLSLPDQFPTSQAQYCRYELGSLRPNTASAILREKTRFPTYAKNVDSKEMEKFAGRPAAPDVNGKLIAVAGPIVGEIESQALAKYAGPQKEVEPTIISKNPPSTYLAQNKSETPKNKVVKLDQDKIKNIAPFNQTAFTNELSNRMEVFLNKYLHKYGEEAFVKIDPKNLPKEMEDELIRMRDEMIMKYGII